MNIIKSSKELTKRELYKLTKDSNSRNMKEAVGGALDVKAWAHYEDYRIGKGGEKTDELQEALSILTDEDEVFSTISPSFIRSFMDIVDTFGDDLEGVRIAVDLGESKAGRQFIKAGIE